MFGEGPQDGRAILSRLLDRLVQKTGKVGQYYDEAAQSLREYEKRNWVYPTNLFIKVSGNAPKRSIGGETHFTQPPRFELNLHPSARPESCDMCGDRGHVDDAKMWMYPFVVDPDKFANPYSFGKRGLRLCVRCALAGLAGYTAWLYRVQGTDAVHVFLFHAEARDLAAFRTEVVRPMMISGSPGGNVQPEFWGAYVHESAMGLVLRLFRYVHEPGTLSDAGRELLAQVLEVHAEARSVPLKLYAVTGKPGQAFNMQAIREFSNLSRLFRLYQETLASMAVDARPDGRSPHETFVNVFRQFTRREGATREETIWRDQIARAVLEFSDPFGPVESFLYDVRAREKDASPLVWGTEIALAQYGREVLRLEERLLEVLGGFGHGFGAAAHERNELGLLYGVRNAKRPEEFFRVLNDVQHRLELTIPEALLQIGPEERIMGAPWVRVKTLLSIYAMNSYLRAKRQQQKPGAGGKAS